MEFRIVLPEASALNQAVVLEPVAGSYAMFRAFTRRDPSLGPSLIAMEDLTAPIIVGGCPEDVVATTDAGVSFARLTWQATALDDIDGSVDVVASVASPANVEIGSHTIRLSARDASGNTAECSFNVLVQDSEAPQADCVSDFPDVVRDRSELTGARINFAPTHLFDNSGQVQVKYSPASGSLVPVGAHTVTAKATDGSGNAVECAFSLVVTAAGDDSSFEDSTRGEGLSTTAAPRQEQEQGGAATNGTNATNATRAPPPATPRTDEDSVTTTTTTAQTSASASGSSGGGGASTSVGIALGLLGGCLAAVVVLVVRNKRRIAREQESLAAGSPSSNSSGGSARSSVHLLGSPLYRESYTSPQGRPQSQSELEKLGW
jgi:hypothetical protein